MRYILVITLASCLVPASAAYAEPPPGGYDTNQNVQYNDPNAPPPPPDQQYQGQPYDQQTYPQQQPVQAQPYGQPQAQPYAQPAPAQQTAYTGRGLQYGATLFVPLWLGDINDFLRPGIGIHGRVGWELGRGLSIEGGIGWMGNHYEGFGASGTQSDIFFTGGLRYAFLNPTALVPFIHAEVLVNLWNFCDASGVCSSWSEVTAGVMAGAGLIWEINYNVALELGLNYSGTSKGNVFPKFESWLSPFIGVTLYY